jgi:hypothetical protein
MTKKFILSQEDGTASGGDERGNGAVDLQMERSNANQVAAGSLSVVAGGSGNRASGARSSVLGGLNNTAGGNQSFLGGGQNNQSADNYAVCSGGLNNNASSQYSTVSGGESNTASTNTHATVVGGQSNLSSAKYSISGGTNNNSTAYASVAMGSTNTASGGRSVAFGDGNIAVGNNSIVLSGQSNQSNGDYSISSGYYAKSYLFNQRSHGNRFGPFGSQGDSQISELIASKFDDLTSVGTTVLSLDGTGITNLIIPTGVNRVWNVLASWAALVIGTSGTTTGINVGDVITQCNLFAFKKIAGISSIVGSVTNVATHNDAGMASASMGYTAGASQELALTFTAPTFGGGGSVTLRIVNKLTLTEVAYT